MSSTPERQPLIDTSILASVDQEALRLILEAIGSLRFGAVEITVHDGRVVQLDKRERFRLNS
ncbi:MAG: YezD family protein [FCB group bacterium]|jgi:hypothetical protein|nr:YezD family protein [FCB group bacterium]